ncbi:hypothetical protein DFJ74DRAFT_692866 [Hyaloraphidium curvatum]|nr:hypothetical protein DFJ74DRAFT_692866 [Hyaloraphidium curvatum]
MATAAMLMKVSGVYVGFYAFMTGFFPDKQVDVFEKLGTAVGLPVKKYQLPVPAEARAFTAMTCAAEASIAYYCWRAGEENNLAFGRMTVFGRIIIGSLLSLFTAKGDIAVHVAVPTIPFEFLYAYLTYRALKNEGAW